LRQKEQGPEYILKQAKEKAAVANYLRACDFMSNVYFLFFEDQILLINKGENRYELPGDDELRNLSDLTLLLLSKQHNYSYARLTSSDLLNIGELVGLRDAYVYLGHELFGFASRAKQLLDWRYNSQYCGHCGHTTFLFDNDRALKCNVCDLVNYPRISPCIMVAITRGDEILLARSPHFRPEIFSILAGFVEPGETAEACVHREVFEEVGLTIKNLKFFASQPWPFPNQLMLGFFAEYAAGEINIDPIEIVEAQWFKYNALPALPPEFSLSYRLIEHFVETHCSSKISMKRKNGVE
jgi:NAD+ diphosphatase